MLITLNRIISGISKEKLFMKKAILSIAALSVMFAVGCNKKDDDNGGGGRKDKLVGTWTLSEYGADANGNKVVDMGETTAASAANISGTLKLESNGSGTLSVTLFGSPGTATGTWELTDNENTLRFMETDDTTNFHIAELSSSKLSLLNTEPGQPLWYVLTK